MRRKGDVSYLVELRNKEMYSTFLRVVSECKGKIRLDDICKKVVKSPSRRFWISAASAYVAVNKMLNGECPAKTDTIRRQYEEIFRRFLIERESRPNDTVKDIVSRIVLQGTSEYYMVPNTAKQIIKSIRFKRRRHE